MRKTKKEILVHLRDVAYTKKSALKIVGFLNGVGFIELGEAINFKGRDNASSAKTYKDFLDWFNDDSFEKNVVDGIIDDLESARKDARDECDTKTYDKISKQLIVLSKMIQRFW